MPETDVVNFYFFFSASERGTDSIEIVVFLCCWHFSPLQ